MSKLRAACGTWSSVLGAAQVAKGGARAGDLVAMRGAAAGAAAGACWTEPRPEEGGRSALLYHCGDAGGAGVVELLPSGAARADSGGDGAAAAAPGDGDAAGEAAAKDRGKVFNARSRVHEYGGGAVVALCRESKDDSAVAVFSNFADQRLYAAHLPAPDEPPREPQALTPDDVPWRYADGVHDVRRGELICVREDHTVDTPDAVVNTIVAVPLKGDPSAKQRVVTEGADFYAAPRLSGDGRHLAWVCWMHPDMPFFAAQLSVAELDDAGAVIASQVIAGGDEAAPDCVMCPKWDGDTLYFISDRSGYWGVYSWAVSDPTVKPVAVFDFDIGGPAWVFGRSPYDIVDSSHIVFPMPGPSAREGASATETVRRLTVYNHVTGERVYLDSDIVTSFASLVYDADSNAVYFHGGAPDADVAVYRVRLDASAAAERLSGGPLDAELAANISRPRELQFPTSGGATAYMNYYAPHSATHESLAGEKPPLLVRAHGGPTSHASTVLRRDIQFWTTRGFAVADVNYRGSTGFGRDFRMALHGQWGVYDVEDCRAAAKFLVAEGLADEERVCVDGASAGGLTTLALLAHHSDVFRAGASHYGVADLAALARDTHKFESRYLDVLVGKWPEQRDVFDARSPIRAIDLFNRPCVFFHGTEDRVVPPSQAESMYAALLAKGVTTALVMFEGEGHGFRDSGNIVRALEGQLQFFGHVFGFTPVGCAGDEPLAIDNRMGSSPPRVRVAENRHFTGDVGSTLSVAAAARAYAWHTSLPGYAATPLRQLPDIAAALGLRAVLCKDESARFGLGAFKVLGGSYALARLLASDVGDDEAAVKFDTLKAKLTGQAPRTFVTASAGNHGVGVAWAAHQLGQRCSVLLPRGAADERVRFIESLGAQCSVTEADYDDTVRLAVAAAEENGWQLVQDTGWDGYESIPRTISEGYMVMALEALEQVDEALAARGASSAVTHVVLQAGVGAMAGGVAAYVAGTLGCTAAGGGGGGGADGAGPRLIVVEPSSAGVHFLSSTEGEGELVKVPGDTRSVMRCLACGEANTVTWPLLRWCAAAFATIEDGVALRGQELYRQQRDGTIDSGPSGAATLGFLEELVKHQPEVARRLGLDETAVVLLFNTESGASV